MHIRAIRLGILLPPPDGAPVSADPELDGVFRDADEWNVPRALRRAIRKLCRSRPTYPHLTPRECEIVRLVARGLQDDSIARVLQIRPGTVATHLKHIRAKLMARSRPAVITRILELAEELDDENGSAASNGEADAGPETSRARRRSRSAG